MSNIYIVYFDAIWWVLIAIYVSEFHHLHQ